MKIVIDATIHPAAQEMLEHRADTYVTNIALKEDPRIYEADALLLRTSATVDRNFLDKTPHLKYIGTATTGLNHIDLDYAQQKGIEVFNAPGANADSVADYVFTWVTTLHESITYTNQHMKLGVGYDFSSTKKMNQRNELSDATIGIIGYGNVGSRVAKRAEAFGMTVLKYDPNVTEAHNTLEEVLRKSNFVTLHPDLNPTSHNMIGTQELQMMKKHAYLINASRGEVVDEKALIMELKYGLNAIGAVLDVFVGEPEPNLEFKKLPNVRLTPHIAGNSKQAKKKAAVMVAEQLLSKL